MSTIAMKVEKLEPFGAVTNEALLCGCNCVISKVAGSACLIEEGKNGFLVDPHSVDDIAEKITRRLNDWQNQSIISEAKEYQIDTHTCQIPVPVVERMVQDAAAEVIGKLSENKIEHLTRALDHIEAVTFKTAEEAERAAIRYNNMNNDGGYGYVPRFYTEEEVAQMKQQLSVWEKYAASV